MPEIGETLRETRMRRRIDITEVEDATKIRAKYLRALENEEWDLMPGPTFVKTFLRTYAEYLEIDPRILVEEYRQRFERPGPQELTPFAPGTIGGRRRAPRPGPSPALLIGLVVVLLVGLLFAIGKLWPTDDEQPSSPNSVSGVATPKPEKTSKPSKAKKRRKAAAPAVARLQIVPTGTVSVCLVDASGDVLINNVDLIAGAPTRVFRSKRFRVSFGNGAARLRVGKRRVNVPDRSVPVGYDITSRRIRETSRRPDCS